MATQIEGPKLADPKDLAARAAALDFLSEGWGDALRAGIDSEHVAIAALHLALTDLVNKGGEPAAEDLLTELRDKLLSGAFRADRIVH